MKDGIPQVPITQKVQPEAKSIPPPPQKTPIIPQASPKLTLPKNPKKRLIIKILIILLVLIGLGIGGFFIWKNFFVPETEKAKGRTQEDGYIYKKLTTTTRPTPKDSDLKKEEEEVPSVM